MTNNQTIYTISEGSSIELDNGTEQDVISFVSEYFEYDRRDAEADQITDIHTAIEELNKSGLTVKNK